MRLLQLERVSKAFGGVRAVSDVTFDVQAGELIGVMGPNGSGETTLFNLIAGGLAPDSGRIRFRGADVSGWAPHRVARSGIARTFQLVRPFMGMSARDNVLVGGLYGRERRHRATAAADADRLLARVGLDGKAHVRAAQLTLIDRKRLELARFPSRPARSWPCSGPTAPARRRSSSAWPVSCAPAGAPSAWRRSPR